MSHYTMRQCEARDEGQKLLRIYYMSKNAYPDVYWNTLNLHPEYTGRKTSGNKQGLRQ